MAEIVRGTGIRSRFVGIASGAYPLAIADQVIYSAGNMLLLSQLARSMSAGRFGAVASVYALCQLAIAVLRAATSDVLISERSEPDAASAAARSARGIVAFCATVILIGAVTFELVKGPTNIGLLLLILPVLLVQDRARYELIQVRSMRRVLSMDALWLFVQLGALTVSGSVLSPSAPHALLSWLLGCSISISLMKRGIGFPSFAAMAAWLADRRMPVFMSTCQSLVVNLSMQIPVYAFALASAPAWAGGYVAASSLLGPQSAVASAIRPLIFRRVAEDNRPVDLLSVARRFGGALALTSLAAALGIAAMYVVGDHLYGAKAYESARLIVPWLAVSRVLGVLSSIYIAVLRSDGHWRASLRGEILTALVMGLPPLAVAAWFSAGSVAPVQALGASLSVAIWHRLATRRSKSVEKESVS